MPQKPDQEKMAIACCLICMIAEAMKACESCPFKAGLQIKAEQESKGVLKP